MRIAVVNHHRQLVGGAESYLNRILPELEQAGHQTMLFHEAEVSPGASLIEAPQHTRDWSKLASFRPNLIFNNGLVSPNREWSLADFAPVVHFAHNYHGTCISGEKTRKLPYPTACSRQFGPGCLTQYLPRNCGGWNPLVMIADYHTQRGRHQAMRRARVVLTASKHMQQEYIHNGMSDVRHIPLFVPHRAAPLPEPKLGLFRILFAGRMTRVKGAAVLAEAAPLIRQSLGYPVSFTFAGDGPDRARAAQLCPDAHFPGWLSQRQLHEIATDHHILAMPGIWPEPFGLTALELGLPAAAFSVGGIPDWLTDGENGTLAEPPSPAAFAQAIVRCFHLPHARQKAQAAANDFSLSRHLKLLLPLLETCAS